MKIPSSTLKSIALSAGITASAGSAMAAGAAPERASSKASRVAPQPKPAVVEPALKEPRIAICEKAPEVRLPHPGRVIKPVAFKTSKQIFAEADANKDGKLDSTEFNKAFQLIVAQEKAKAAMKQHKLVVPQPRGGDGCPGCGLG